MLHAESTTLAIDKSEFSSPERLRSSFLPYGTGKIGCQILTGGDCDASPDSSVSFIDRVSWLFRRIGLGGYDTGSETDRGTATFVRDKVKSSIDVKVRSKLGQRYDTWDIYLFIPISTLDTSSCGGLGIVLSNQIWTWLRYSAPPLRT